MTTIRKIVTSKVDGNNANSTDTNEVRPFGETAFYVDTDGPTNKLVLSIHDGERTHLKSKVLAQGILYGSNADSGDGNNYDTIKLIPDATLHNNGSDQYLIVDPTAPTHIHIRAGGTIDNSNAALILGGENSNVEIQAGEDPPVYVRANNNTWMFDTDGSLTLPTGVTNNGRIINDNGISLKVDSSYWTFGTDGTTTFPNDSIITSNTELNIATSPTTTYTFSQAYWEALNGNNARIFTPTNNAQYFSCIVTAQQDGTYTVDITGAGNTFVPGNWFKVPGDELGGSAPANDIQITVATVGGGGEILTVTVTGTAVGKQWTFGTDGSLTIPGDIQSENDVNITVDSGDSSAYTWNFGQTGDLSLPGGGLLGQVWGDGIDTELTLKSPPGVGDSGYVALSSANERNYVEVSNIGVVLGVEFGQAGFKKLTFGTDGNLKSADGEPLQILSTGAGGAVSLAWSSSLDSPENIALVIANSPGAQTSGAVDIVVGAIAGPNIWTFDPSGALTIPGDIQSEEDISIRVNLSDSTTRTWRFGEDGDLTFPDGTTQATAYTGGAGGSSDSLVNGELSVTLGSDAVLTFPDAVFDGENSIFPAIHFPIPESSGGYIGVTNTGLGIQVVDNTWKFEADGSLTFPDATVQTTAYTGTQTSLDGDVTGSVFADDSTLLVDGVSGKIVGDVETARLRTTDPNIALGIAAGETNQGVNTIAIGAAAGQANQGTSSIAIGGQAGNTAQGVSAVALGAQAGSINQGAIAVSLGTQAGSTNQGLGAVAVGTQAGIVSQGNYAVALGYLAGANNQPANSIVINASGSGLDGSAAGFYVNPVRNITGTSILQYDATTGEITHSNEISSEEDISIRINLADSTTRIWRFGEDGDLTLPGNFVKLEIDEANPDGGLVVSVDTGTGTGSKSLYKFGRGGQFTSRAISVTNTNGDRVGGLTGDGLGPILNAPAGKEVWVSTDGQHLWRFTADRDFVLPYGGGNIRSEGNINIDINLSDSTMRRWQFGEDGDLAFPDATVQTTAWAGIPGPYADDAAAASAGVAVGYPYHKTGTGGQVFVRLS